jgi:hypothetical protein
MPGARVRRVVVRGVGDEEAVHVAVDYALHDSWRRGHFAHGLHVEIEGSRADLLPKIALLKRPNDTHADDELRRGERPLVRAAV